MGKLRLAHGTRPDRADELSSTALPPLPGELIGCNLQKSANVWNMINIMMKITGISERFWAWLREAPHRLLALDYDGTLAPFHVEPAKAVPLDGIGEVLDSLLELPDHTLAIVSGRPVREVSHLLGGLPLTYFGSHGYEWLKPSGELVVRQLSSLQKSGLEKAGQIARRLGYVSALEFKAASIALHTRPMRSYAATRAENLTFEEWSTMATEHDLECRRFNGGVEIRCVGIHKGDALLELIEQVPTRTITVYIGDDETDEDAFRVLRDHGVGIKVGPSVDGTAAEMSLADCAAVRSFLQTWQHCMTTGDAAG